MFARDSCAVNPDVTSRTAARPGRRQDHPLNISLTPLTVAAICAAASLILALVVVLIRLRSARHAAEARAASEQWARMTAARNAGRTAAGRPHLRESFNKARAAEAVWSSGS